MGYKSVCVNCRKAFSQGTDFRRFRESVCPECGEKMTFVNQKFKPPKQNSKKEWEIIGALLKGGYTFDPFYQSLWPINKIVPYPTKLSEVEDYLVAYKNREL